MELIEQSAQKTASLTEGWRVLAIRVLAIRDTTELNCQAHAQRTHGLGTAGNGSDKGLFLHPMLTLDAYTGAVEDCQG
ncbi:MAG: hypothetical protein PHG00_06480 [Methylococcales bacterium]|nr:hypothetical protein [Methylococcales bacterium]